MIEAIKDVSQIFERTLTNNQGNFVTGQTITFEVRNSSTDTLITNGTMTEQNEVYKFSFTFTSLIEARVKFFTPLNFPNDLESIRVVEAPADSTDVADIITEINENETKIDALPDANDIADQVWDETLSEHQNAGSTGEALENADATADPGAIADAVWDEDLSVHLGSGSTGKTLDDIENKTTNLPTDPASETNATTNKNSIISEVDDNETKIDSIITTLSTIVSDIWSFVTRTLTGIGSSGIASEANATTNTTNIIAEIDANELKIDAINLDITAHRTAVEDKIKFILGLTQHNTQIKDTVFDSNGNMTSGVIKLYNNATDAENDTNSFKSYQMTATFSNDELQTYIVSEI